jgi:hypothetical protein
VSAEGQVKLFFNCQAVEKYGVGVVYRSADLFHSRDMEIDEERIILELFKGPYKGQAMLTYIPHNKTTKIAITKFIRQMEISFKVSTGCPIWYSGGMLYLDLNSA